MGPTWAKIPIWDPHGSNLGIMPRFCPYGTHLPMRAGSFTRKCQLTTHMITHTRENIHSCGTCKKSFTNKQNLTLHMIIHTGDKPYICGTCGKSFARKLNIQPIHVELVENLLNRNVI